MGKIALGILDGVSGKVGNVVGANWKGIDYIRAKATNRRDPKTEKQVQQRTRFKGLSDFAKPLVYHLIAPVWNHQAGKMTGMNLFTKTNMPAFNSQGEIEDFSKLVFSIGKLASPTELVVEKTDGTESGIDVSWVNGELDRGNADDRLMLVAIDKDNGMIYTQLKGIGARVDESTQIELPFGPGDDVQLYFFYGDVKNRDFSRSLYTSIVL